MVQVLQTGVHTTALELFWLMSSDHMMVESKDKYFSPSVANAGFH